VIRTVAIALLLAGCATVRPATGPQWGYFSDSESVPSLKMVVYMADRPTCEVSRAKDMRGPVPGGEWAKLKIKNRECVRVMVDGSGSDYWTMAIVGLGYRAGLGFRERDWCRKAEEGFATTSRGQFSWSTCEPVGVKVAP
jgi:hypothetical protein